MDIPESMRSELGEWNNRAGIDLKAWIGCEGNFSLAVGYSSIFWPDLFELNKYVFRRKIDPENLIDLENHYTSNQIAIESFVNHFHIADIQHYGCPDCSSDKLLVLGQKLQEIYTAKLRFQFPGRTFKVEFYIPEDPNDYDEYQLTFWQE